MLKESERINQGHTFLTQDTDHSAAMGEGKAGGWVGGKWAHLQ